MKKNFAVLALLALAACSGMKDAPSCPEAGFMAEADRISFFGKALEDAKAGRRAEDVSVSARLANLKGVCKIRGNKAYLDFSVDAVASKTALGRGVASQNLSYFIAVLGPDEEVLQRRQFYTAVEFKDPDGRDAEVGFKTEEHEIEIPLADLSKAGMYSVLVGFTLAPEQLEFNRKRPL